MIEIKHLVKKFSDRTITNDANLNIPEGKMTVIVGRSGEGKSLLLKQIIGLIKPTSGHIYVDNIDITMLNEQQLNEQLKKFGYVFQFAALLDSLTVWENIGLSLLYQGYNKDEIMPHVKEKLSMVQLPERTLHKYPSELSGGMAKRVGLARTLITDPKIILYDEPTTGLDPVTERHIHELMFDLQKQCNVTSIVVTHSTNLFQFADRIAFLYEGRIAHAGPAEDIWQCTNPYVYQFIRGLPDGPLQTY